VYQTTIDEQPWECVCALVKITGPRISGDISTLIGELKEMGRMPGVPSRLRFMILDLAEDPELTKCATVTPDISLSVLSVVCLSLCLFSFSLLCSLSFSLYLHSLFFFCPRMEEAKIAQCSAAY
jgi:hypothetical protein